MMWVCGWAVLLFLLVLLVGPGVLAVHPVVFLDQRANVSDT